LILPNTSKNSLNADTVIKIKEVFHGFDYDGSGNISVEELVKTVKVLNLESQAGQIVVIVNNAGVSGEFDFSTFVDIFGFGGDSTNEATIQTVTKAFKSTDTGHFDLEEFEKMAASESTLQVLKWAKSSSSQTRTDRDEMINFKEVAVE